MVVVDNLRQAQVLLQMGILVVVEVQKTTADSPLVLVAVLAVLMLVAAAVRKALRVVAHTKVVLVLVGVVV
jgi:hypothetical protein